MKNARYPTWESETRAKARPTPELASGYGRVGISNDIEARLSVLGAEKAGRVREVASRSGSGSASSTWPERQQRR